MRNVVSGVHVKDLKVTGFEFTELRSAHEENHVHSRHASAETIRRFELTDHVSDDRADGIGCAGNSQAEKCKPERTRQAKDDGCQPVSGNRIQED